MGELLGSQSSATRLFAVVTTALLAIFSVLAGASVLIAERVFADFDLELPALTLAALWLGITPIALCWIGYMGALVFLLGYQSRDWRSILVWIAFCAAVAYLMGTIIATLLPYTNILYLSTP